MEKKHDEYSDATDRLIAWLIDWLIDQHKYAKFRLFGRLIDPTQGIIYFST